MIRHVLPAMRKQKSGTIINVSPVAGRVVGACMGIYSASKFALEAASEALAQEVVAYNIRVRLIEPGFIVTPILDTALRSLPADADSAYPNAVESAQMLYAQGQQTGGKASSVAAAMEAAINETDAKLR